MKSQGSAQGRANGTVRFGKTFGNGAAMWRWSAHDHSDGCCGAPRGRQFRNAPFPHRRPRPLTPSSLAEPPSDGPIVPTLNLGENVDIQPETLQEHARMQHRRLIKAYATPVPSPVDQDDEAEPHPCAGDLDEDDVHCAQHIMEKEEDSRLGEEATKEREARRNARNFESHHIPPGIERTSQEKMEMSQRFRTLPGTVT